MFGLVDRRVQTSRRTGYAAEAPKAFAKASPCEVSRAKGALATPSGACSR